MAETYSAATIAKWFAAWAEGEDAGLSNLKLQKLLYYAQGHHLALFDRPLFVDQMQAWSHGPVVPDVYHAFKHFRAEDVRLEDEDPFRWEDVDPDTTQFLIRVWNTYGPVAAWRLRNMTHDESPWRDHFRAGERHLVIPEDDIRRYFKERHRAA